MVADLSFPPCSPLAAAHPKLAAAKGEQGKAKKKAVKPLASCSRHSFRGDVFPRSEEHRLCLPSPQSKTGFCYAHLRWWAM